MFLATTYIQPSSFLLACTSFKISPCIFRSLLSILPKYTNLSTWSRFSLFIITCYCLCNFPAKYKNLGLWYINANIQSHTLCCVQFISANHLGSQPIAEAEVNEASFTDKSTHSFILFIYLFSTFMFLVKSPQMSPEELLIHLSINTLTTQQNITLLTPCSILNHSLSILL